MPKKETSKYFYILGVLVALLVIGITISASFAFFTNSKTTSTATVITSGSLSLELVDGEVVGTTQNMVPGDSVTKTFIVRNTGTLPTTYDVYFSEVYNTFVDKSDLVYSISSSDGGYNTISDIEMPHQSGNESKIISAHTINANSSHTYTLTIKFLSKNENQDDNKGASFSGKLQINDYKNYEIPYLITHIKKMAENADPTSIEQIGNTGLAYDQTVDNNLRYIGSNPNNYVNLPMEDGTTQLWRIIGIFNSNTHGKNEELVKIIGTESIGNDDYSKLVNVYNSYVNDSQNYPVTNKVEHKLAFHQFLEDVTWKFGTTSKSDFSQSIYNVYNGERSDLKASNPSYASDDYVLSWDGKALLPYASDIIFSTNGYSTKSREYCINTSSYENNSNVTTVTGWNSYNNEGECVKGSWLASMANNFNDGFFTITLDSYEEMGMYFVYSAYNNNNCYSYNNNCKEYYRIIYNTGDFFGKKLDFLPSAYLKSNVQIVNDGNDGSREHPYNLMIPTSEMTHENEIAITLNAGEGSVEFSTLNKKYGETFGNLPNAVPTDNSLSFVGWYSDEAYTEEVTSETIIKAGMDNLYAKYINENGYNYWTDNYSDNNYSPTSAPATIYPKYSKLVTNGESKALMRTTYVNGSPTKHEACLYYGGTNKMFCLGEDYWETVVDSTEATTENKDAVKSALKNDMETALGVTIDDSSCVIFYYMDNYSSPTISCSIGSFKCETHNYKSSSCYANSKFCSISTYNNDSRAYCN